MSRFRRVGCGVVLLFLAFILVVPVFASMSVAPLSLVLEVPPGEEGEGGFLVRNTGTEPIVVNLTLHDWWRTPEGSFQILPPETMDQSCAPWMIYSASTLELAPGQETEVSVRLTTPEEASGDHWALLLVEEQPQPAEEQQAKEGLTNTTRVVVTYAVKILQKDPVNASPNAEIQGMEIVSTDPFEVMIRFANTGNAHITTEGTVEIRDVFGDPVRTFTVTPFPTLPGEERFLTISEAQGAPLPAGTYYAIALLDFGGDYLIQGGLPFEVDTAAPQSGSN